MVALARVPKLTQGPEELSSGSTQLGILFLLDFDSCLIAFITVPEGGCAAATDLLLWDIGVLLMGQRGEVLSSLVLLSNLLSKAVCSL